MVTSAAEPNFMPDVLAPRVQRVPWDVKALHDMQAKVEPADPADVRYLKFSRVRADLVLQGEADEYRQKTWA